MSVAGQLKTNGRTSFKLLPSLLAVRTVDIGMKEKETAIIEDLYLKR